MKKIILSLALVMMSMGMQAQKALFIRQANGVTDAIDVTQVADITFSADRKSFTLNGNYTYNTADVTEMTYGTTPTSLSVKYNGDKAEVINPFFATGVSATINGANVTVNNTNVAEEYKVELSGETTTGSYTYVGAYKTTLTLSGVNISNPKGAAIDIQCGKRVTLELKKGTTNVLDDGKNGSQKAALYCKGHLEIDKSGNLTVTGNAKHAIAAKEYVQVKNGVGEIRILSAASDGIHCGQFFQANGGSFIISNVAGDGIQAEVALDGEPIDGQMIINGGKFDINITADDASALKADSLITICDLKSVPEITIVTSGNGDKGIKTNGEIAISAGKINITQTGSYFVENGEMSCTTGIKADGKITISGGEITINNTAEQGKPVSSEVEVIVTGGTINTDLTK